MKKTISRLLLVLAFASCGIGAKAQLINEKFGKPSAIEWKYVGWGEASKADAIVLCKTMDVTYKLTDAFGSYASHSIGINDDPMQQLGKVAIDLNSIHVNYDVKLRTKILKPEGAKHANIDIVYFEEDKTGHFDEVCNLKVTLFSKNEKGKVVKTKVNTTDFATERINDTYKVMHVVVPNAQAGDIIEYTYSISSSRSDYLYDWTFREDIPVVHSKCDLNIPAMLQFKMNAPISQLIKANVIQGQLAYDDNRNDRKRAKTVPTNHYTLTGDFILPKENIATFTSEITGMPSLPVALPADATHLKIR